MKMPRVNVLEFAAMAGYIDFKNGDPPDAIAVSKNLIAKFSGYKSWRHLFRKDPDWFRKVYKAYLTGKDG